MKAIEGALQKLIRGEDLKQGEIETVLNEMIDRKATPAQIGAFLVALHLKGESAEELAGAASFLRSQARKLRKSFPDLVDTCGTGGDRAHTINLSTAAAMVAAGAGVRIAKHGNRAVSSQAGSADVLQALGIDIEASPEAAEEAIETIGIGFFFAPLWHPAMKAVAPIRRELGIRTLFNLLGPLLNPAAPTAQVLGVFSIEWLEPMAESLRRLGSKRAFVVHGEDGLDEFTLTGKTHVVELREGSLQRYDLTPEELGLPRCSLADLRGGDAEQNARRIVSVLKGEEGAVTDAILLNSAAAILVASQAADWKEALERAREAIRSGSALQKLEAWKRHCPLRPN